MSLYYLRIPATSIPLFAVLESENDIRIYYDKENYVITEEELNPLKHQMSQIKRRFNKTSHTSHYKYIFGVYYNSNFYVIDIASQLSLTDDQPYLVRMAIIDSVSDFIPLIIAPQPLFMEDVYALKVINLLPASDKEQFNLYLFNEFNGNIDFELLKEENLFLPLMEMYLKPEQDNMEVEEK